MQSETNEGMKTPDELFREKVESVSNIDLYEKAQEAISKMCQTGGSSFTMTVPPSINDTDIVLTEILRRWTEPTPINSRLQTDKQVDEIIQAIRSGDVLTEYYLPASDTHQKDIDYDRLREILTKLFQK